MNHPLGHHIIGGFEGTSVTPGIASLIREHHLGGVILFRRNIESPKQVRKLVADLQKIAPTPLLVGVDQEGGRVFRLGKPFTQIPPMAEIGAYYGKTKDLKMVRKVGEILGRELRAVGVNWDYAPVLDVHSNPLNPIIGNRAFSPNPEIVATCAKAVIRGLHAQGILSCAKHFPGHGATSEDSHCELPVLKDDGRLLWKRDVLPYRRLIPQGVILTIMTAHVRYLAFDKRNCATLSRKILTDMLRHRLGYQGIITSDDMFMKGITSKMSIPEATLQFFEAGGDLALICKEPQAQMETLEFLTKELEKNRKLKKYFEASHARILKIKKRFCRTTRLPPLGAIGSKTHEKTIQKILLENAKEVMF